MAKQDQQIFRGLDSTDFTARYKRLFQTVEMLSLDPKNVYGQASFEKLKKMIEHNHPKKVIGISDPEEYENHPDYKFDKVVAAFVQGCGGQLSPWRDIESKRNPIALRSIVKTPIMDTCRAQGRDFYYIDTGYFGNWGKGKTYHRIVKNAMQHLGPIIDRPDDRFLRTNTNLVSFKSQKKKNKGSRILICPPSEKAMRCGWGLDLDQWLTSTMDQLSAHTDRQIIVREKKIRHERQVHDTIWEALADDVYCVVTYNSIAAVEALIAGKPVFALGPNAAHHFACNDLAEIENPLIPDDEEVRRFFCHLAYCQFTKAEMLNGEAWAMLRR